jgi:DNA-binding NarL/FixJ family response regulator
MITMYDDDESVFTAMRAGARGYVLKGADQTDLLRAVTAVANGDALFSADVARKLIRFFAAPRPDLPVNAFPDLTEREREVLELIAQRRSNAEIARALGVAGKTVRNHVSNVFSKLQVADRAEAIAKARGAGFGEEPS